MKGFICDNCEKRFPGDAPVELKGANGRAGGILLPEHAMERTFCTPNCFWEWTLKYNPITDLGGD